MVNLIQGERNGSVQMIRWAFFVGGISLLAFGIAVMIRADLGGAPWDVLHIGLTLKFGLTVGTWSILAGIVVLGLSGLLLKRVPQLGAFLNMLLVGLFLDLFLFLVPIPGTLMGQWFYLLLSFVIIGIGIGIYIAPQLGAGPRDSLMIGLQQKTGWSLRWVRSGMEAIVLLIGWLLGGPVSVGTLLFVFGIGYVVGMTVPSCKRLVDAVIQARLLTVERRRANENFNEGPLRPHHHDGTR
ncbi:YczE/YyaS/YitT family protein [Shouchella shacheensis]|uniref:YczE/YyaS/YitT family protein n=1 Tax=Shouchella shacheensis TaxID=1649580 RepID=UPI00073FD02A|nr:membrane protein [Shouchella shacheensis]